MASLIKKPRSKFWFACFRDANGRQRRKSTRTTDIKKARAIADQYEQVGQRKVAARTVRETIASLYREIYSQDLPVATVRGFIKDWLAARQPEVSPATIAFYRKATDKLLKHLGAAADLDLSTVTRRTLVEFRNSIAKTNAPVTVNHDLKSIKMVFRAARRDGYIIEDPGEFVDTVRKASGSKRKPFTIQQLQSVLAVADPEWQSLIKFGLYTGQRLGDLASLTWDNLDTERGEIRLRTRKTGKQMILPIAKPLREHIESLPVNDVPGSPIHPRAFATMHRQHRSGNLSNQFADLLSQAGLREKASHHGQGKGRSVKRASNGLTFHSLRHTAVTLLKHAGVPQATVQALIGHDSEAMSAIYTHVGEAELRRATDALPAL